MAVEQGFFFFDATGPRPADVGLRLVIFLTVSHELTRSGSSAGSSLAVAEDDEGMNQLLVDASDRRIFTLSFESAELEFDDDDDENAITVLSFSGSSI